MVTSNEHLILDSEGEQMEFYLNDKGEIFVHNMTDEEDLRSMFFTISKEDWEQIKSFIDYQFS